MSEQISLFPDPAHDGSAGKNHGSTSNGVKGSASGRTLFDEHKGKLAIGVAATLGAMIFYNWRERRLARKDPEGHARVNRLKALVRADSVDACDQEVSVDAEYDGNFSSQIMNCPYAHGIIAVR